MGHTKDRRSWDRNRSTYTVRGENEWGKVTKQVDDLQLGNTWAAEKIKTKTDQSKTLNILMVLGGDSCGNADAEN